jgi:diacylglycerol kinase (ATP)
MSSVPPAAHGVGRIFHAGAYSIAGLRTAWDEAAFRQEAVLAAVLLPLSFVLGANWLETAMLAGVVVLVLIVELLNSAVEATIDRIGPEWHELSRQAKDMGSAAVLLSLLFCAAVWAGALVHRFA